MKTNIPLLTVELDASNVYARSDLAEFYLEAPAFMGGGKSKARREAEAIAQQDAATGHWLQARIAEKDQRLDQAEQEYKNAILASQTNRSHDQLPRPRIRTSSQRCKDCHCRI